MKQLFLFAIVGLVGCASTTPVEPERKNHQSSEGEQTSPHGKIQNPPPRGVVLGNVVSYFYTLYPKGSGEPVSGIRIEDTAVENGYLKVTGEMEGYFIFALFKGKTKDYVVEQSTGCGPECDQKFKVYEFMNGKLIKSQSLDSYYPKKQVEAHIAKMKAALPLGNTNADLQSWIRLPKVGTAIEILIVEQNPGATTGKVKVYKIGKLLWNGNSFDFLPDSSKALSNIVISEVQ